MKKLRIILPLIIILITIFLGIIKINIINTKAFSEKNNNLQGVNFDNIKDDFGKEFSNFILDKAILKIHQVDGGKYILEINGQEYKLKGNFNFVNSIKSNIDGAYEDIKNIFK
ncbi:MULTISPECIES: hypothetical protein [Clostridium]|uniref:Uncharacterized protein n=1 Tax=Clostridium paridis TaxID=2803863 RepID=A0A937K439_9CLOT|nr:MULTISPECIES: hypothetical protein [Clostridium]MBL4932981.1 hypothetical protein [Clostridium paridis]